MLFSIIVPVYKVEKYLSQCVESVLGQSFSDYEIILVDDGSPDKCPDICDDYAKKDARVRVLHKPNGGLSDARNAGLEIAQGEYIIFIDSDDYWDDSKALEKICELITQQAPDAVTWRYKKYFEDSNQFESVGYTVNYSQNPSFQELIKSRNFTVSACGKAIKKELFEQHNLKFEKGIYSEDIGWCARLLAVTSDIIPSNLDFYIYRQRSGSITHEIGKKNIEDIKKQLIDIESLVLRSDGKEQENLKVMLAEEFLHFVVTVTAYKGYKEEICWIKSKKHLLKCASSKRSKILRLMISLIGVKLTIKLIGLIR